MSVPLPLSAPLPRRWKLQTPGVVRHLPRCRLFPPFAPAARLGRGPDWLFSARGEKSYTDVRYERGSVLVFGRESAGLPAEIVNAHPEKLLTIPSRPQVRSLNLSNCAAIVAYEAVRQWGGLRG